ncbi:MAG: hypothetical protein JWO53_1385 [Chlamydiia bacterium]|nr:hypothetical protein [Chlamydiia bacterium]
MNIPDNELTALTNWANKECSATDKYVHLDKNGITGGVKQGKKTVLEVFQYIQEKLNKYDSQLSLETKQKLLNKCKAIIEATKPKLGIEEGKSVSFWNFAQRRVMSEFNKIQKNVELDQRNSFEMMSYNIGASSDDYELLLATTEKPVRDYQASLYHSRMRVMVLFSKVFFIVHNTILSPSLLFGSEILLCILCPRRLPFRSSACAKSHLSPSGEEKILVNAV